MAFYVVNKNDGRIYEFEKVKDALEEINDNIRAGYSLDNWILIEGEEIMLQYGKVEIAK